MVNNSLGVMPPAFSDLDCLIGASADEFGGGGGKSNGSGGVSLSWSGLNVWQRKKISTSFWKGSRYNEVQVLRNVSGSIQSGTLTAIMGPSGAGKTTLLAAVSMRVQGNMTGNLMLNGVPVSWKLLSGISGFVPQQDIAIESLTIEEHMLFMARMKMDRHTQDTARKKKVKELIREIGLIKCFHTKISALSGGERKRLSLAAELLTDPPILFCDEPTTGLDSWAAASVVSQLRSLAAAGRAILCVLHQPASGTFQMFHRLMLLTEGKVAYMGPLNEAKHFFSRQNFHCPLGYNEAEFLVNVISSDDGARTMCNAWEFKETTRVQDSDDSTHGYHELSNGKSLFRANSKSSMIVESRFQQYTSIEKPGKLTQFFWLTWRFYKSSMSEKKAWLMHFLSYMGLAILISIPYQNIMTTINQQDIQNVQGLLYLIVTETIFLYIYNVFNVFPSEIPIMLREVAGGIYSPGPYYLSKVIFMIPRATIESFLYTAFIFWVVGLNGGFFGFMAFIIPVVFSANSANAYGTWLSASFESITTAALVSVPIDFLSYLFVGNFVNIRSLSVYVGWIKYFSIFFYSAEAISILQWTSIDSIECDTRDGLPCIETGEEVLDYFGFGRNNYFQDLYGMMAIYIGFHIFGFIALWRRSKRQAVY